MSDAEPIAAAANPNDDLLFYALRGDAADVIRLLNAGAAPNASATMEWGIARTLSGAEGTTVEHWHLSRQRVLTRDCLSELARNRTALFLAVEQGHYDVTTLLLDHGADPNAPVEGGWTPLLIASERNDTNIARALLRAGADPKARRTESGTGALLTASRAGNLPLAEMLVSAGADVNGADKAGVTPLMGAVSRGDARAFVFSFEGLSITDGIATPLPVEPQHPAILSILLDAGADIRASADGDPLLEGHTALHYAASRGDLDVMRRLIEAGADVNASAGTMGGTPLGYAVGGGSREAVELLLAHGADVNAASKGGTTALKRAASQGNTELIELLLEHGAQIGTGAGGEGGTALFDAAGAGQEDAARCLLSRGADVNARDHKGWTALMRAATPGYAGVVRVLIAAGADPNARDAEGHSALDLVLDDSKVRLLEAQLRPWDETVQENIDQALDSVGQHLESQGLTPNPEARTEMEANINTQFPELMERMERMHNTLIERVRRLRTGRDAVAGLLREAGAKTSDA